MTTEPIPAQHHIDMAREDMERLQMKLGKIEGRAILSSAQAKADKLELDAVRTRLDEARDKYRSMVDRFTHHDRIQEATAAIRAKLMPQVVPGAALVHPTAETTAMRPPEEDAELFEDTVEVDDPGEAEFDEFGDVAR